MLDFVSDDLTSATMVNLVQEVRQERCGQLGGMPDLVRSKLTRDQFKEFFADLVSAMTNQDWEQLHKLSDRMLDAHSFKHAVNIAWRSHFNKFNDASTKFMDIELNMDRLNDMYKNMVLGFTVMTVHTYAVSDDFNLGGARVALNCASTELLFTYNDDEFVIISRFKPFMN